MLTDPHEIGAALGEAGLQVTLEEGPLALRLHLRDWESLLCLYLRDGEAESGAFRHESPDNESIIQRVAAAFKSIGWEVEDDAGKSL